MESPSTLAATTQIDQRIKDLADWRGQALAQVRKIILATDPAILEE